MPITQLLAQGAYPTPTSLSEATAVGRSLGASIGQGLAGMRRQRLAPLAEQALGGDNEAFNQLAAQDPQLAAQYVPVIGQRQQQQRLAAQERLQTAASLAQTVLDSPAVVRPQAYANAISQAQQMGMDVSQLPGRYTPDAEARLQFIINRATDLKGRQEEFGQLVAAVDERGRPTFIRAGKRGSVAEVPGYRPATVDPEVQERVAASREAGKARGKAGAEAEITLPQTIANAEQTLSLIDKALTHPGREVATGASSRLDPRNYLPGTDARDFQVLMDQLGGKAFLEAFETLKGGGQITEVEGKKATDAIARLNATQSEEEFVAALKELRTIVLAGIDRARKKAGVESPAKEAAQSTTQQSRPPLSAFRR